MSIRVHTLRALLAVATLTSFAAAASAATIEITFSGAWNFTVIDTGGALDGSVDYDTPFSGTLRFDPAAVDQDPSTNLGRYDYNTPPFEFSMETGSYTITANALRADVSASNEVVNFGTPSGATVTGPLGFPLVSASLQLRYEALGYMVSDDLEDVSFELAPWAFVEVVSILDFGAAGLVFLNASVQSVTIVPEPSTLALVGGGLLGLLAARRPNC